MKEDYVRLIISDLHLGAAYSNEEQLYEFLSSVEFDELILAGDVIDFIKIPRFTDLSAKLFDLVQQVDGKVIYIVGNHDKAFDSFIGKKVCNIDFVRYYEFEYAGRKYKIEHGDKYEKGVVHWRGFMKVFSVFQDIIERYFNFDITTWWARIQNKKRKLRRIWDIVKWNDDADVFIMGHTHKPEVLIWVDENENLKTYVNTGDWVDHCTYVIIKDNQLRLKNYKLKE